MSQRLDSTWKGNAAPKLGDEIRGVRFTKGYKVDEVAKELRLKPEYIKAIEDHNLDAFPSRAFISGYVRSYAKFLGLDAEHTLRRFLEETNLVQTVRPDVAVKPNEQELIDYAAQSGNTVKYGLMAVIVVVLLVGTWSVIRTVFLPSVQTPVAEVEENPTNTVLYDVVDSVEKAQEDTVSYDDLVQSSVKNLQQSALQDGPISAIISVPEQSEEAPAPKTEPAHIHSHVTPNLSDLSFRVENDIWIKVETERDIVFQGTLASGQTIKVPETLQEASHLFISTRDAGSLYIQTPQKTYGPLGQRGQELLKVQMNVHNLEALAPEAKISDKGAVQN